MSPETLQSVLHWAELALCMVVSLNGGAVLLSLAGKLPSLTQHLFDWIKSQTTHVKNAYAQGLLQRALLIVNQMVLKFENNEIESLKAQMAAGSLKPEDLPKVLADLKKNAVDAVKGHMGLQGILHDLEVVVFGENPDALVKWIEDAIEAAVSQLPASGLQTPKSAATNPSVPK